LDRLGTVAIVGVGLIGGSVGLALRARGTRVVGIGRDPGRLDQARALGAIDEGSTEPARGLTEAEVVVVCTPVTRIAEDVLAASRLAPPECLITDAGSTKRELVEAIEEDLRARSMFVGAHPIAGSEKKGAAHAQARLFENRPCVLTPTPRTPPDRLERARSFWGSLGCRLAEMDPGAHDAALALTSHLPHVVAAALAGSVPGGLLPLAGGAYRDGTRVAGSDPALWAGIVLANRGPVLDAIDRFSSILETIRRAIAAGDGAGLEHVWKRGAATRALFDRVDAHGDLPGLDPPPPARSPRPGPN
jgi:prephenate dehydrogenase